MMRRAVSAFRVWTRISWSSFVASGRNLSSERATSWRHSASMALRRRLVRRPLAKNVRALAPLPCVCAAMLHDRARSMPPGPAASAQSEKRWSGCDAIQ